MGQILKRFNRLIKSMLMDTDSIDFGYTDLYETSEKDYSEAWEVLNNFLSSPADTSKGKEESNDNNVHRHTAPEMLRPDYANMEVPFGSNFELIKKSYKKLIRKHHPDNNNENTESQKKATEKSKKLIISFQKIKTWELSQKR